MSTHRASHINPTIVNDVSFFRTYKMLLEKLLIDRTTGTNIYWATDNYSYLGTEYNFFHPIDVKSITGKNESVILSRVCKATPEQKLRVKQRGEVFTPSWLCNKQNNIVDAHWFGREDVFNIEITEKSGEHIWIPTQTSVKFPLGKTWKDYICENRMEITCGEAPYLISRFDAVSGEYIPVERRIGLLDRKLRIVGENTDHLPDWYTYAVKALQSIYGFEWQGDSLLLARKGVLLTMVEYYFAKFDQLPPLELLEEFVEIITWNLWQMDGLTGVLPMSCQNEYVNACKETIISPYQSQTMPRQYTIDFECDDVSVVAEPEHAPIARQCEGCSSRNYEHHKGVYCLIMDWGRNEPIRFVSLLKKNRV